VAKKTKSKKRTKKQPQKKAGGLRGFMRDTRGELRKVSWPTRREAQSLTVVVIIVMVVMAIFLGGFDYLFFQFFELIWAL
jgi:preprotein translocase subunit SecE